ncbi:carbohydrate ABC transporter membrane protein 2, CUT1 family [Rhodoferax sp. OV413]|uniref:carbohydrate ABC transporter permease n=1 Tax=Rhodoferax sp. OV413 TaxID=1855285 RepID=UPI00088A3711|nr:carbohydrate ABC transporter permease [Rhodoferax sp. OV413]SDP86561.1 carbohydrate ABC transporter membrane protein 2, CUT1 family [Rhodoferax sp. OV413]
MTTHRLFSPGRILAWAALLTMLAITLAPLWMVVKTALMQPTNVYTESTQLLPSDPTLGNFQRVLGFMTQAESEAMGGSGADINFMRALGNSLVFTATIVVLQVTCASMAAYAFARLRFPGRNTLFALFVGSMMVPSVVTFIPNFILIKDLGLLNTMTGMVAPFCLMQGFSVFFLRQFFLSIPRDLEEAALLDGASFLYIFARVVMPLSITPLATIAMLTGINMWNEFFWPFLVAKDEMRQVLPVALQSFKSQTPQGQPDWTGLMAATAITVMPTILLLVVFGRRVVESVQFSGGK